MRSLSDERWNTPAENAPVTFVVSNTAPEELAFSLNKGWGVNFSFLMGKPPKARWFVGFPPACMAACDAPEEERCPVCEEAATAKAQQASQKFERIAASGTLNIPWDGKAIVTEKTRGKVDVTDFRSAGPSIGLTSKGSIDMDANTIDLKGALVPAYALNSILGNIPIIGEFLQGGKGEGLFSATYSISGDLNEPKIDVNGWSALAPGFIRNLFEGEDTGPLVEPKSNRTNK